MKAALRGGRLAALVVLLLVGSALWLYPPEPFTKVLQLLLSGSLHDSIAYIRSFGPYAIVVSFVLVMLINVTAVLPNIFILAANGIIFGITAGTLVSWAGEVAGVIVSFGLLRYFLREYAQQMIDKNQSLQRVNEFSGKNGFKIMLLARSIPFVPSGLITALGAVSSISWRDYILATMLGKLPSVWIEVTLGHDLASYREHTGRLGIMIAVSLAAYFLYGHYKKK